MKNYTLHLPEGVKDFVWQEAEQKENLQNQIKKIFYAYSYHLIETPTFEYLDVFTLGEKTFQEPNIYKWVSRQGEILALRSDITCAIARVAATENNYLSYPKRYAYVANSFRYPERYQGKMHEFTQAGIELVGDNTYESDAEVIQVAIQALREMGLQDFTIHIGSSAFLACVLGELGIGEDEKQSVYEAIENKDGVSLAQIFAKTSADNELKQAILQLIQTSGTIELVHNVKQKVISKAAKEALEELENIYHVLEAYGVTEYILFDFNILSYAMYYTGIMFQGFAPGIGSAVVEGGRYDKLLCEFGKDLPAVGFGINLNLVLQKLQNETNVQALNAHKTLLVYQEQTRKIAFEVAATLRTQGMVVENSFCQSMEEAICYGKTVGIGGILNFKNEEEVEIYNLLENTSTITTIEELLN